MTTVFEQTRGCALCGTEGKYRVIGSTNSFGSADLDTRPPEMSRSTIRYQVQQCLGCGFCASDISKNGAHALEMVKSAKYQWHLLDESSPTLANSFVCAALVDQVARMHANASWNFLRAAWVCDDEDDDENAIACRTLAADAIERAMSEEQKLSEQMGVGAAILVDVLRRSSQFDRAKVVLANYARTTENNIIDQIMTAQASLVEDGNTSCYTIADALRSTEDEEETC